MASLRILTTPSKTVSVLMEVRRHAKEEWYLAPVHQSFAWAAGLLNHTFHAWAGIKLCTTTNRKVARFSGWVGALATLIGFWSGRMGNLSCKATTWKVLNEAFPWQRTHWLVFWAISDGLRSASSGRRAAMVACNPWACNDFRMRVKSATSESRTTLPLGTFPFCNWDKSVSFLVMSPISHLAGSSSTEALGFRGPRRTTSDHDSFAGLLLTGLVDRSGALLGGGLSGSLPPAPLDSSFALFLIRFLLLLGPRNLSVHAWFTKVWSRSNKPTGCFSARWTKAFRACNNLDSTESCSDEAHGASLREVDWALLCCERSLLQTPEKGAINIALMFGATCQESVQTAPRETNKCPWPSQEQLTKTENRYTSEKKKLQWDTHDAISTSFVIALRESDVSQSIWHNQHVWFYEWAGKHSLPGIQCSTKLDRSKPKSQNPWGKEILLHQRKCEMHWATHQCIKKPCKRKMQLQQVNKMW